MRRFLVFGLLGPPLGFVTGFYGLIPAFNWAVGDRGGIGFDWHQIVLLPLAYVMGFIPALVTAAVDDALARRHVRWRPLWTTLFAFAASFLPLGTALAMGYVQSPLILIWGLIGAVPGFVCSTLSGRPPAP